MVKACIAALLGIQALAESAATISVSVGGGPTFNPETITAAVGDTIEFRIKGHSATQGDFNNACQPAADSPFFSGVLNNVSLYHSLLQIHPSILDIVTYTLSE